MDDLRLHPSEAIADVDGVTTASRLECGLEAARLAALDRYDVLDTPREEAFDRITRLAKRIFGVPIVVVALLDAHRQWFKSRVGLEAPQASREPAFCNIPIVQRAPLVVEDTLKDARFTQNDFVTGDPKIRFYAGAPVFSPDGHVLGTLCLIDREPREFGADQLDTLKELAQVVMDELELRQLATSDALTGAASRRAFREELGRALHLATRHDHELSLIVLDLDHFKQVNDKHGHPAGDAVLARSVAACLKQLRVSDVIGRLGGEEFGVLLPHTGPRAAFEVAERLRAAIADESFSGTGGAFQVTASFGVAAKPRGTIDADALIQEADAALYLAKMQGRDRCVMARPAEAVEPNGRRRVLKGGKILFDRRARSRDCTIRSLSDGGAGIDVVSTAGLPDTFELAIDTDARVRPCRIVAVTERKLEVEFV